MKNNCYIDIHVLQTVPPSCVNRDDTGSPKTAVFGGKTRARVSSQAWKHAMREEFKDLFPEEWLGNRTKQIVAVVAEKVLSKNPDLKREKVEKEVLDLFKKAGLKMKSIESGTDALFFISNRQAEALAALYLDPPEESSLYKMTLQKNPSIDMALFGRMVASDQSLNVDASAQVAHAISTHAVANEYDYFTAVDDYKAEEESGAGHLGTIEFNSSTLYRYASLNLQEFANNLKGESAEDLAEAVALFIKAFMFAMPTGKQNTFANRTVPDMVYLTIRKDQPVNLAGSFEKAISAGEQGFLEPSKKRLHDYADMIYSSFVESPEKAYCVGSEDMPGTVERLTAVELLDSLRKYVVSYLESR